jgi:MFS family permease
MVKDREAVQPSGGGPGSDAPPGDGTWWSVLLFFLANALFGAGLFFHAFLYNFYLQGLGHGEGVMGVAAAAISAGGVLALIPAGFAVDRWGVRTSYLIAALIAAIGLAAGAVVERPLPVYAASAVTGAGAAAFRVTMGPALMRLAGPAIRARAFSWNTAILVGSGAAWTAAAGGLSASLIPVLDGSRVEAHRAALLVGALVTLLAAALAPLAFRMKDGDGGAARAVATESAGRRLRLRHLAIPRQLAAVILVVGVFWTAGALALPFFNIYFQRVHDISIERIGIILSFGQILTAVAVFASGESAARAGPRRMLLLWMFLFPPAIWALAASGNVTTAVVFYMLQAFVLPAVNPLFDQVLLERAASTRHGAVSSWRNLAIEGSGLIGATVGGYLLQASSFRGLFVLAGVLALGSAAAGIRVLRQLERSG